MHEEVLKGNFKVKRPVAIDEVKEKESLQEQVRKKVMSSLAGSMVYVERNKLNWDGHE